MYSLNSAEISAHPPKWYQPIVGATFAPNNVLTQFSVIIFFYAFLSTTLITHESMFKTNSQKKEYYNLDMIVEDIIIYLLRMKLSD